MLCASWLKQLLGAHFNLYLLGVVLAILAVGVGASLLWSGRDRHRRTPPEVEPQATAGEHEH